jgi:hypothetical protein
VSILGEVCEDSHALLPASASHLHLEVLQFPTKLCKILIRLLSHQFNIRVVPRAVTSGYFNLEKQSLKKTSKEQQTKEMKARS